MTGLGEFLCIVGIVAITVWRWRLRRAGRTVEAEREGA